MKILSKILPIYFAFCCYHANAQIITQKTAAQKVLPYTMPKGYADELAALNKLFPGSTEFKCWKVEVEGRALVLKFRDDTECRVDFAALNKVTFSEEKGLIISCANNKKCIDFGGGRLESSISIKNTSIFYFPYFDMATLFNVTIEAIRYTTLSDAEWEAYNKKMLPKNEAVWKAALNDVNDYLLLLDGPQAHYLTVQGKYIIDFTPDNKPWVKFHSDDVKGAFVVKKNMTYRENIAIGSDDELRLDAMYHYLFKDRYNALYFSKVPPEKKKDLVNKLNTFLFAFRGSPVPDSLIIKENIKTDEEEIRAKATTPFEKAMAEIKIFLLNRPYGNTYFTATSYNNTSLVIETLNYKDVILLDRVGYVAIKGIDAGKPVVYINSSSKGYCDIYNGTYYETCLFSEFNKEDAVHFFQLLGNMMDAYKQDISKEKQDITYAEKYKLVTSPSYLEKIEAGSTVKVTGVQDSEKNKKKLKKLIDEEVTLATSLDINGDMQSYTGDLLSSKGDRVYASAVMVSYVKGKNGENIIEQRTALQEKNRIKAEKDAAHDKMLMQGLKFVHQFLNASQAGTFTKYISSGKLLETDENGVNRYELSLPDMPSFIREVFLFIKPGDDMKTSVALNFEEKYKDLMMEIMDYKKAGFRLENPHYETGTTGDIITKSLFVHQTSIMILHESASHSRLPRLLIFEVKGLIKN